MRDACGDVVEVLGELLSACARLRRRGVVYLALEMSAPLARLFQIHVLGVHLRGPPFFYWSGVRHDVLVLGAGDEA